VKAWKEHGKSMERDTEAIGPGETEAFPFWDRMTLLRWVSEGRWAGAVRARREYPTLKARREHGGRMDAMSTGAAVRRKLASVWVARAVAHAGFSAAHRMMPRCFGRNDGGGESSGDEEMGRSVRAERECPIHPAMRLRDEWAPGSLRGGMYGLPAEDKRSFENWGL